MHWASEGKMKGEGPPSLRLFNNEFGPSASRISSSLISFERVSVKKDSFILAFAMESRNDVYIGYISGRILKVFSIVEIVKENRCDVGIYIYIYV